MKTAARLSLLALLVSLALATPGWAEEVAPTGADTPEMALQKFIGAMRMKDFDACAKVMHPEALAEFQRIFVTLAKADAEVAQAFFGSQDQAVIDALSGEQVFAKAFETIVAMEPMFAEIFSTAQIKVLGDVPEDDVRHVVYRMTMQLNGATMSEMEVVPFKKHEGRWHAMLTGDMEQMIMAMEAQLGGAGG